MNISDTFYIALCMTVLIIGVVYWFWTQTQHLQRKINLLENIVYEFKSSMSVPKPDAHESHESHESQQSQQPHVAPYSPQEEDEDLLHETLQSEISPAPLQESESIGATVSLSDDLQPGGVGSGLDELMTPEPKIKASALDGMTLKELRRLAEQRNIPNASTLRKQALIEALRAEPKVVAPSTATAATPVASVADDAVPIFEPSRIELQ